MSKRVLKVGVDACLGLRNVMAAFSASSLEEKHVAEDLFGYFDLTEERQKEIGFREPSDEDRKARNLSPEFKGSIWNPEVKADHWSIELSGLEWSVLRKAMRKYEGGWNILRDFWEKGVSKQLDAEEIPAKATAKKK